jgi:hypothetical protein
MPARTATFLMSFIAAPKTGLGKAKRAHGNLRRTMDQGAKGKGQAPFPLRIALGLLPAAGLLGLDRQPSILRPIVCGLPGGRRIHPAALGRKPVALPRRPSPKPPPWIAADAPALCPAAGAGLLRRHASTAAAA